MKKQHTVCFVAPFIKQPRWKILLQVSLSKVGSKVLGRMLDALLD